MTTWLDLRNDFVFRRVFGHSELALRGLLNDVLDRRGADAITSLEYLPSDQAPEIPGFKLSIVDVKCRDASGHTFVVEMQMVHVKGFLQRVMYNAAKAYIRPLRERGSYADLTRVIGVSICNFALWPDDERDRDGTPRIPMASRWRFAESTTNADGIDAIELAFFELPKLGDRQPATDIERWATLFLHAAELEPRSIEGVPLTEAQREALRLSQETAYTPAELEAYEKVRAEIWQAEQLASDLKEARKLAARARSDGIAEGHRAGVEEGHRAGIAEGLRQAIVALLASRGITATGTLTKHLDACDEDRLRGLLGIATTTASADALIRVP